MNLAEIKQAIADGKKVYWASTSYEVIKDKHDQYFIHYKPNDNYIGLTWTDGQTLNGNEDAFFTDPQQPPGDDPQPVKRWNVISPDGFSIHREDTYESHAAAVEAFNKWKENYKRQGYYSSTQYGRIPLEDLEDYCEFIEFNQPEPDEDEVDAPFSQGVDQVGPADMLTEERDLYEGNSIIRLYRCQITGWTYILQASGKYYAIAGRDSCEGTKQEVIEFLQNNF